MDHQALKTRHRQERESHHPNFTLRVHRALSWLNRAEQADDVGADAELTYVPTQD